MATNTFISPTSKGKLLEEGLRWVIKINFTTNNTKNDKYFQIANKESLKERRTVGLKAQKD